MIEPSLVKRLSARTCEPGETAFRSDNFSCLLRKLRDKQARNRQKIVKLGMLERDGDWADGIRGQRNGAIFPNC
jgi:hypothetical protein